MKNMGRLRTEAVAMEKGVQIGDSFWISALRTPDGWCLE